MTFLCFGWYVIGISFFNIYRKDFYVFLEVEGIVLSMLISEWLYIERDMNVFFSFIKICRDDKLFNFYKRGCLSNFNTIIDWDML